MPRSSPTERQRRLAEQIRPPYPPDMWDRAIGRRRLPPGESVASSFLTQRTRVWRATGPVDLVADSGALAVGELRTPAFVLSAWHPHGRPCTVAANETSAGWLQVVLGELGVAALPAATVAESGAWVERSVVVSGASEADVVAVARSTGQPAVVRLDDDGWHLVPSGLVDLPRLSVGGWRAEPARLMCPLRRPGLSDDTCDNPGGFHVGRAMEVGGVWNVHQQLMAGLLGCHHCAGTVKRRVGVHRERDNEHLIVASRYGGWEFS